MPRSAYKRVKTKRGFMYFRNGKLISKASYNRGTASKRRSSSVRKKSVRRRVRKMAKRKTYRRRSNPMTSYSKSNVAMGTLLGTVAPKFLPGATTWLPLVGLLPKSPTSLKVMSWMIASKVVSDRFITR